jgi:hypothetical protein
MDEKNTQDRRRGCQGNNYLLQGALLSQWRATTLKRITQCLSICTSISNSLQGYIDGKSNGAEDIGLRRSRSLQDQFSEIARMTSANIVNFLERIEEEPEYRTHSEVIYIKNIKDSEILVVTCLQNYIKKKGGMGLFEIRVRDESAFTGVLNALGEYWSLNVDDTISPVLTCFFQSLTDRRFVKPIPRNKRELDSYIGKEIDTSSEKIRMTLRDIIWWISLSKHIQPWAMSRADDHEYHSKAIDVGFSRPHNSLIRTYS